MARLHTRPHRLLRRLRPSTESLAAAAAVYDPSLLLQWKARQSRRKRHGATRAPLSGETGAALLLVAAVFVALVWSNGPWHASYVTFWHASVALTAGPWTLGADLRTWVDEGLMTLFFLVVGLEAKRERDLGELREGRRLTVPVLAGLAGMAVSAAVYVAVTAGRDGAAAGGWGVAISTDTALALAALSLTAGVAGERLRVFLLTLLVVDDVVALLVISLVYPGPIHLAGVVVAVGLLLVLLSLRAIAARQFRTSGTSAAPLTPLSVLTGIALWLALFESGFDPVVTGLLIGLLTNAYQPKPRGPAPISPNHRLQHRLYPFTSKVVVPLFALANAGLRIDGHLLASAAVSPVTWGIVLAYVIGKPLGILIAARAAGRRALLTLSRRELRGTALSAGIGLTVSLLIASRAFHGELLDQAKLGILATAVLAPALAAVTLAPLRRSTSAAPARRGSQVRMALPCPAR